MNLLTIHKPSNCTLLIGIPVTIEDYHNHKYGYLLSDFLARCCRGSSKFYNEVCEPVKEALPLIRSYGCNTVLNVTETEISSAFSKDVVIIFTHWTNDHIEIRDKMISNQDFCSLIPKEYNGVIDLCACQPEDNLVVSIKTRAPNATVKCTLTKITPAFWIEIIRLALYILIKHNMSYQEALTLVITQINSRVSKSKNR